MGRSFSGGGRAIVASPAAIGDAGVIELRRPPRCCRVTRLAGLRGRHMIDCLALRIQAIVASSTPCRNPDVSKE
jgi:hypothetical protein